jgi:hypothetical protein
VKTFTTLLISSVGLARSHFYPYGSGTTLRLSIGNLLPWSNYSQVSQGRDFEEIAPEFRDPIVLSID